MTLAADRGLDVTGSPYESAVHHAALSDIIVTVLRERKAPYTRPADAKGKSLTWVSSAFLAASNVRLEAVLLVDRWNEDRKWSVLHSWRVLGECAFYEQPMTLTVVLVGQRREGKHSSPWSKGWLHPRSRTLRIRKRTGEGFGGEWKPVWREEADHLSRDLWLDTMREDGVMPDVVFDIDVPAPCPEYAAKVRHLAEKKVTALHSTVEKPDPNISVCSWPTKCPFLDCCWEFHEPSEASGFITICH